MKPTDRPEPVEAPPVAVPLRAGPLRLVFDRGELRWIRLGEREVLRGIYAAVRERGWATVPARLLELEITAEPLSFRIAFVARHQRGDLRFDWTALIQGRADGRIVYTIDGMAGSTFLRNRIGFCVLHPAAGCAGAPCTVETVSGEKRAASFPRLVSPFQPFLDLRAISHEPAPGVVAEVRMEGDIFETEDQRNWSDASFKTYCTPLALPYPAEVVAGTRLRQSITLTLHGVENESVNEADVAAVPGALGRRHNGTEPVLVQVDASRVSPLPALGVSGAGDVALEPEEVDACRRLGLSHLRADLHLEAGDWPGVLEQAVANARLLGSPLELALFLPDEPQQALAELSARARKIDAPVGCWLLFRASDVTTHEGDAALARGILGQVSPGATFAGGVDRYFAELNRRRPSPRGLDRISFSVNPQVHAFDDATLFENIESLVWLAETARAFAGALPLGLSPVTLRPRGDPRPPSSRAGGEPFCDDPRQQGVLAASWLLGFLRSATGAGFASLTFFELEGPRGLMDEGRLFPAGLALAEVAAFRGGVVLESRSQRPERIQVLALRDGGQARVFLANISADPHPVRLDGLPGRARCAPLGSAPGEICELEHELPAHSILRLDVECQA